jgi:hypothetical protein
VRYVAWGYSSCKDSFFVTSHLCTGDVEVNKHCKACNSLGQDTHLQNIIARYTNGVHDNASLVFHGIGSLIKVVHWKMSIINTLHLCHLNNARKLVRQESIIDIHKQMLLALSTQHIPQIDRVLWVGFKHGAGIHSMLEMIKKAAEGMYHPKGFDKEEDLQALLFLHLGSTQVADIAHQIFGTPLARTICTCTIVSQILPSPTFPTHSKIQHNVTAAFEGILEILGMAGQNMLHAVLMFDKLGTEKWPQWDNKSNKVLRVCHKHGHRTNLEFTSEEDLEMIWKELGHGNIHLAHKVHVFLAHVA